MCSKELPHILEQRLLPPRASAKAPHPIEGASAFSGLATRVVKDLIGKEMEDKSTNFLCTNTQSLSMDDLQIMTHEDIIHNMRTHLPITFDILQTCATGRRSTKKGKIL